MDNSTLFEELSIDIYNLLEELEKTKAQLEEANRLIVKRKHGLLPKYEASEYMEKYDIEDNWRSFA